MSPSGDGLRLILETALDAVVVMGSDGVNLRRLLNRDRRMAPTTRRLSEITAFPESLSSYPAMPRSLLEPCAVAAVFLPRPGQRKALECRNSFTPARKPPWTGSPSDIPLV